jgi:AMP deaminase
VEEYLTSKKIFGFSNVDLSEIAKNSVLISNFDHDVKADWLGPQYWQPFSNDSNKSNIPNIRDDFRRASLAREFDYLTLLVQSVRRANIALDKRAQQKPDN